MTASSFLSPQSTSAGERFSWNELIAAIARTPFQFAGQKVAYMAQCILESASGKSRLFREAGNPTGMKWRDTMADISTPLRLVTPTEPEGVLWCSWIAPEGAIEGYLRFIQRDRYQGWEAFGNDPEGYIQFIKDRGYATDPSYVSKVIGLLPKAKQLLELHQSPGQSLGGSITQVDEIFIDLSAARELIVYAKAQGQAFSSIKSSAKAEVANFLSRHQSATRIEASGSVNVIPQVDLLRLPPRSAEASWLQFWKTEDGAVALLGMVSGSPVSGVSASTPEGILSFLSNHPKANTVQVANLASSLIWQPIPSGLDDADPDHGNADHSDHHGHSSTNASLRPPIESIDGCRNFSSRNGSPIDAIVLHYTTSRNLEGSISWFKNPASEVSAHYIVGLDGSIVQLVKDGDKAWHCFGFNTTSIGIEHVAQAGDRLTPAQERASAALLRWLIREYKISGGRIYGHRWNPVKPGGTPCPGDLWRNQSELQSWLQANVLNGVSPSPLVSSMETRTPPSESIRTPFQPGAAIAWNDMNSRVSRFFTVGEVTQMDRRRIPTKGSQVESNIILLAQKLDQVREIWGSPIGVSSWYRPNRPIDINAEVGGVIDSQHIHGLAADIYIMDPNREREFEDWLDRVAWSDLALGYGVRSGRGFTHVDMRPGRIRWNY